MRSNYDYKFKYSVQFYHAKPHAPPSFVGHKSYHKPIRFTEPVNKHDKIPVPNESLELIRSSRSKDFDLAEFEDELSLPPPPGPPGIIPPPPGFVGRAYDFGKKYAIMYPGDRIRNRKLLIRSPLLLNAIRAVVAYSAEAPSGDSHCLKDGDFPFPYRDLYYHKDELLNYKISHPARTRHSDGYNAECDRHIDLLIDFLYSKKEINLKEAEDRSNMVTPSTTFGAFWLLMKPGSDVYVFENGRYNAYVVDSCYGGPAFGREHATPYMVHVWNLYYYGNTIRRHDRTISVPVFDGEQEIQSMPLFPVRFYKEQPGIQPLRDELIMRGKYYLELSRGPSFREYSGYGLESGKNVSGMPRLKS